jgi:hypothetical protein
MFFPPQPILRRTLSHEDDADEEASTFFHQCKDGDTIFSNYWAAGNLITYAYFTKVGDQFIKFQKECFRCCLPAFTFYVSQP